MSANECVAFSALIMGLLGCGHLVLTYVGRSFGPRDVTLELRLKEEFPVITSQTTMWRGLIGFHVSHSLGLIFIGVIYSYLPLKHGDFFFQSPFLVFLGAALVAMYLLLARLYWFFLPLVGFSIALAAYLMGLYVAYA